MDKLYRILTLFKKSLRVDADLIYLYNSTLSWGVLGGQKEI